MRQGPKRKEAAVEEQTAETYDRPLRFSFLGPVGTFCNVATLQVAEDDAELVPAIDIPAALKKVRSGEVDYGVVPIENSIEGSVNATLDTISSGAPLEIKAEMLVPIRFSLAVREGTELSDIRRISTHPHAWAQCRNWIATNIGDVVHVPATSTAAAATMLAEEGDVGFDAALCSVVTARDLGLVSLSDDVADNPKAVTRFIMVGKPGRQPDPTGADKTTLTVQLPDNEAGALMSMLEQFAVRGVNLSRIESRPLGDSLGRYGFSIDAEGHIYDERIQAVLIGLHRSCPRVTFHGSYPSASGHHIRLRPGTSNSDFQAARRWVHGLLGPEATRPQEG